MFALSAWLFHSIVVPSVVFSPTYGTTISGQRPVRLPRRWQITSAPSSPLTIWLSVTRAGKHSIELAADQFFDGLTRPSPHCGRHRIKQIVEKINGYLGCRL